MDQIDETDNPENEITANEINEDDILDDDLGGQESMAQIQSMFAATAVAKAGDEVEDNQQILSVQEDNP